MGHDPADRTDPVTRYCRPPTRRIPGGPVVSRAGGGGQLQELESQLQELEQVRAALQAEVQELRAEQVEIDEAIEALESLETGATVQVPVGGDAFVRAEVQDIDEVVVKLGGEYAAEQDRAGAIETLEHKTETIDDRIDALREDISEIESQTEELEQEAQQLQQEQLQQLQQQLGQQGGRPPGDQ